MPQKSDTSLLAPLGFMSASCGYCTSNARQQLLKAKDNDNVVNDKKSESSQTLPIKRLPDSRACYYARSERMQVEHYQILLDRGWRRSGKLFYKPEMKHSCCPHYTIRLPVGKFLSRRDQRNALHKWNKYVLGDSYVKEAAKLHPISKAEKARRRNEFSLVEVVHEAEFDKLPSDPPPGRQFSVTLEPAVYTEAKYQLYCKYQQHVHGDSPEDCSKSGFRSFLCDSPIPQTEHSIGGTKKLLGSYHQCYHIDGDLIAIGVIDLLPHCVSGVYFVYDPDYEKFSLGKISALREACLALEGKYEYYYMGYYIHSCGKMRYKNDYQPQQFLDCETNEWNPLNAEALQLMDNHHYLSLSNLHTKLGETEESERDARSDLDEPAVGTEFLRTMESQSRKGLPLSDLGFAGTIPPSVVGEVVDLDNIQLRVTRTGAILPCQMLRSWDTDLVDDTTSTKGIIAELIGCIGTDFVDSLVIDFARG